MKRILASIDSVVMNPIAAFIMLFALVVLTGWLLSFVGLAWSLPNT